MLTQNFKKFPKKILILKNSGNLILKTRNLEKEIESAGVMRTSGVKIYE